MDRKIVDAFLKDTFEVALKKYCKEIPHADIFDQFLDPKYSKDVEHIKSVISFMEKLTEGKVDEVVDLHPKDRSKLEKIIASISEDEKVFLLFTALYHDIGKAINRPRHGAVGADLILRTRGPTRRLFYAIGFTRGQIYLMSNLIRFHDYLGGLGTGETSYLAFAEVLYPVTNMCLIDEASCKVFFNYLLLLSYADVAGAFRKRIDMDTSMAIMADFEIIVQTHENISRKISDECAGVSLHSGEADSDHLKCMVARNLGHILPELQKLAQDNTVERLRRLLRTGFLNALQNMSDLGKYKNAIFGYKKWVDANYSMGKNKPKKVDNWFIKDYQVNDVIPIVACLNALNVKNDFYEQLAFVCKLDYELTFIKMLFVNMIGEETLKNPTLRKGPHNFRRDLAMALVFFINTLVELFGCFTKNNTRIGIGLERMKLQGPKPTKNSTVLSTDVTPYKIDLLRRLAGEEGIFKQIETLSAFKNSVNVWVF